MQLYLGTGGARCTMVQASAPYLRYGYRRSALTGTLVHGAHPYRVCCGSTVKKKRAFRRRVGLPFGRQRAPHLFGEQSTPEGRAATTEGFMTHVARLPPHPDPRPRAEVEEVEDAVFLVDGRGRQELQYDDLDLSHGIGSECSAVCAHGR